MRHLLLVALLVVFGVQAETVTIQSSGTGTTCKEALDSAKHYALQKANGSFIHSVQRTTDGKYNATIQEYSGGVIKSYKYLRDDCTFVIIEAEVERRSNIVQMPAADVKQAQVIHIQGIKEEQDRKQKAIQVINKREAAVYFQPEKTEFKSIEGTDDVQVSIKGKFAYNDKWVADYLALREVFGYFNLTDFANEARIRVTGLDAARERVFTTTFDTGENWKLWQVKSYGATRTMEIKPHAKEEATVRFRVSMRALEQIKSFEVNVL